MGPPKKKSSLSDALINRYYHPPQRRGPSQKREPPEEPWKWAQTSETTWKRLTDQDLSAGVQNDVPDPFTDVQEGVYNRSLSRSLDDQKRTWKVKADRNSVKNRYMAQKTGAAIITTVLAVGGTLAHFDLRIQIILYSVWAATILISDPLGAIGRFLAVPSRALLVGCCATLVIFLCRPGLDFLFIGLVMFAASWFSIRALNESWLSADNWKNTAAAQKAIERDPDSLAERNWQADGRREVKTALAEMGIGTDPNSLDTIHRAAFIIGYSHGLQKTAQIKATEQKLSRTREELENLRYQYETRETELENELRTTRQDQKRAAIIWNEQRAELQAENERLLRTNEELIESIPPERDEIAPLPASGAETTEEKVLYAREKLGYSYADCGKFAGCSKTAAYNIIKKAEEKAEEKEAV